MTSRGRSAMANAYSDRSCDSSPDPLALSTNSNNNKAMRQAPFKEPLTATSPSKQNRRSSIAELDFLSPAKSMIMNTPRMGGASPWRIKVTVQAEPESNEENSPSIQRVTRTKTTTVPLKDPDAQTPAKRPRGRPRKSDVGTTAKPKRKGTPVKKAPRSKSRDVSLGPAESSAADVDTDAPPKRRRGRPRKSVQPPLEDEETLVVREMEIQNEHEPEATTLPVTTIIPGSALRTTETTPAQTHFEKQFRARKGTPHAKKAIHVSVSSDDDLDQESDVLTPTSEDDDDVDPVEAGSGSIVPSRSQHLLTPAAIAPAPSSSADTSADSASDGDHAETAPALEFEDEEEHEDQDATNFAFDEGATRMPDDTTVLDSENFSMISVDSLPSGGALSSPPQQAESQGTATRSIGSLLQHEYLLPTADVIAALAPRSAKSQQFVTLEPPSPVRPILSRYKTPVVDTETPLAPPAVEPLPIAAPKTDTPRMGRVVTAGVALQGALDPTRVTPDHLKRAGMDDLFRGFSDGTRKELQAGLRLGEQLAEGQTKDVPALGSSSSSKAQPEAAPKQGVFRTQRKYRQSRLLTPEDHDDPVTVPAQQPSMDTEVKYPTLNTEEIENPLLSPASSEDEMSWRIDTPPVAQPAIVQSLNKDQSSLKEDTKDIAPATESKVIPQDDYSDIWQEEARGSSSSPEMEEIPASKSPQLQDLFVDDGPIKPARGKLPRTWRRKTADHFQYSDEAESPQQPPQSTRVHAGKVEDLRHEEEGEASDASEASDDTGMFFQSNLPSVFSKKRSPELRQRKADKQSLSSLLDQGESLLPDSSPPAVAKTSPATKTNPFIGTPPRFPGLLCSPSKSSPLRRELRGSDISSDSPRRVEDESTLPLPQSSPFHTFVDGDTGLSVASDQRQFRVEMEGSTSASIRQVREEANEYLDAYEPQERSLNEITEITEPSRTWHAVSIMPSSPPQRQSFAKHMPSPTHKPVPLFRVGCRGDDAPMSGPMRSEEEREDEGTDESSVDENTPPSSNAGSRQHDNATAAEQPEQQATGLLGRVTSAFNPFTRPQPQSSTPHPILSRLTPLPRVEPWTKTHYKALDKLYTAHLKHPALFAPSMTPATPLSTTNAELLRGFLVKNKQPYVGAKFSAWGYSMHMTEELIVLCAVFMENLSLASVTEYKEQTGKAMQMGDCVPGRAGDVIKGGDVLRRLATVVLGEEVRRDEKKGIKIDRRKALEIEWPH